MYIAIMSTHIFVDAIIVCMADARSGVGTNIVFDVSCRGMLARPTQGSGSMPSVDTSGRLGADQNPGGGGLGRSGYGGDAGEAGTSRARGAGSKSTRASQG
jgi:hypothetical protein